MPPTVCAVYTGRQVSEPGPRHLLRVKHCARCFPSSPGASGTCPVIVSFSRRENELGQGGRGRARVHSACLAALLEPGVSSPPQVQVPRCAPWPGCCWGHPLPEVPASASPPVGSPSQQQTRSASGRPLAPGGTASVWRPCTPKLPQDSLLPLPHPASLP